MGGLTNKEGRMNIWRMIIITYIIITSIIIKFASDWSFIFFYISGKENASFMHAGSLSLVEMERWLNSDQFKKKESLKRSKISRFRAFLVLTT